MEERCSEGGLWLDVDPRSLGMIQRPADRFPFNPKLDANGETGDHSMNVTTFRCSERRKAT